MILFLAVILFILILMGGMIDGFEGVKFLVDIFQAIMGILTVTGIYAIYAHVKDKDNTDPFA